MELEQIDIDPRRETEGVWFAFEVVGEQLLVYPSSGVVNGRDVGQLLVGRAGNDRYALRYYELMQERRERLRSDDPKAEAKALSECQIQAEAETVLLGWKNIREKGVEIEPSVENRTRLLGHYKLLRRAMREAANQISPYRFEDDAAGKKTSDPALSGIAATEAASDGSAT